MAHSKDKLDQKRHLLIERTSRALALTEEATEAILMQPRMQSIRVNTLKTSKDTVLSAIAATDVELQPFSWFPDGLFIQNGYRTLRDHPMNESGDVYIQNAASWLPVCILQPEQGQSILDVCAAPGGKTSHIAQLTQNKAFITANDNSRPRLYRLQRNLERLGVENVTYTLHDATRLAKHLEPESFNAILLDAPCSGEGMMTLDTPKDFESWSVAHIKRLQSLQKKIVMQAWKTLKPGGSLVYSTCTMAPEENEAVIDYLLRRNEDAQLVPLDDWKGALPNSVAPVLEWNNKRYSESIAGTLRLKPSETIEAFYVAKVVKRPPLL